MATHIVSSSGFDSAIRNSNLVVIDFYATWCQPCKVLTPLFEKLTTQYPQVRFCKVDVDTLADVVDSQRISAMPTIVFYKKGREVARVTGADIKRIEATIQRHC
jgi:thioredoxin